MLNAAYLTTGLRGAGGRRALSARRHIHRGRPHHAAHGDRADRDPGAAATDHRRPARAQHAQASADQDRGHGGALGRLASPATSRSSPGRTRRPRPTVSRFRSRTAPRSSSRIAWNGLFPGLKSVPPTDRPPVVPVFFAFRIMLGIGFFMIAAALFGAFLWWRGTLFETRWYLAHHVAMLVARLRRGDLRLGGDRERPPALDRRKASCAPPTPPRRCRARSIAGTLALFVLVYGIVFCDGHLLHQPPDQWRAGKPVAEAGRATSPTSRWRQPAATPSAKR